MADELYAWLRCKEGDELVDVSTGASFSKNYVLIYS